MADPLALSKVKIRLHTHTANEEQRCWNGPEMHYIWEARTNGAIYSSSATAEWSGGSATLLLSNTASLIINRSVIEQDRSHRNLALVGEIDSRSVLLQLIYTLVERHLRTGFYTKLFWTTADFQIIDGDMIFTSEASLDSHSYTSQSNSRSG